MSEEKGHESRWLRGTTLGKSIRDKSPRTTAQQQTRTTNTCELLGQERWWPAVERRAPPCRSGSLGGSTCRDLRGTSKLERRARSESWLKYLQPTRGTLSANVSSRGSRKQSRKPYRISKQLCSRSGEFDLMSRAAFFQNLSAASAACRESTVARREQASMLFHPHQKRSDTKNLQLACHCRDDLP